MKTQKKKLDYIYTESEEAFWKYHSMGCGFTGEWKRHQVQPGNPITFKCPMCGSAYMPVQDIGGQTTSFVGNSIEMFARATDEELICEMTKRFYWVEKKPLEFWIKRGYWIEKKLEEFGKEE